jgi:hypothetical protein
MTKKLGVFAAAALALAAFVLAPGTVMAQSSLAPNTTLAQGFSGNFPMTWSVVYPKQFSGKHKFCLTLTDNGSVGFSHSGQAALNGDGDNNLSGVFQVINNELVATFLVPTGNGELDTLMFAAPANNARIGKGFGEESFNNLSGTMVLGAKGGCGKSE